MISLAHVHPMFVHFPLVLFLSSIAVGGLVLVFRGDLTSSRCFSLVTRLCLWLGTLAALIAAWFGDDAKDIAIRAGFPAGPIETHEAWATATIVVFAALSVLMALAQWRKVPLLGSKGWGFWALLVVGGVIMLITAYHGGDLVYHLGVNVDAVKGG